MSSYITLEFIDIAPAVSGILVAELSEISFYAFEEKDNNLSAFIKEEDFNEDEIHKITALLKLTYVKSTIPQTNWNAKWESEFEPIIIEDFVCIRASFHSIVNNVLHDIVITPKMSFGTGHHATTFLMLQQMRCMNFFKKNVLDFGTGTGLLAIMSKKLGAKNIVAIDNDDWSIHNARENFEVNNCGDIILKMTDSPADSETNNEHGKFDIILANINLNVITSSASILNDISHKSTEILLSGFLIKDEQNVIDTFYRLGYKDVNTVIRNDWASIILIKS
jgi:ribosomal protein L11 methyltransferase